MSVVTFNLVAQTSTFPAGTCNDPKFFCSENLPDTLDPKGVNPCVNGNTKIFFSFFVSNAFSIPSSQFGYTVNNNGVNVSSQYKLYGPFSPGTNTCEKISSFQAPIVSEGNGVGTVNFPATSFAYQKFYILEINIASCAGVITSNFSSSNPRQVKCLNDILTKTPCESCIPKFQPSVGEYIISAWVKSGTAPSAVVTYTEPVIKIIAGPSPTNPGGPNVTQTFGTSGDIIDGWQKIEEKFFVTNTSSFELSLVSGTLPAYFDDIRIYPTDGSAITYVYDPSTLRLMAQLDERNYATIYEYDEEGQLIRVKKETEKGIMTIQENRENSSLK